MCFGLRARDFRGVGILGLGSRLSEVFGEAARDAKASRSYTKNMVPFDHPGTGKKEKAR